MATTPSRITNVFRRLLAPGGAGWLGLALLGGCRTLEPGQSGFDAFPLARYVEDEERDSTEWSVLWPLFEYASTPARQPVWGADPDAERSSLRDTIFRLPILSYTKEERPLETRTQLELVLLFGTDSTIDRLSGEEKRSAFRLVPFIVDELFLYESWRAGEAYRIRCLFEQYEDDGDRAELRLLDLLEHLPLATLLRVAFESDHDLEQLAPLAGSEWALAEVLGFKLFRAASTGGFREVELLSTPLGERVSLLRSQWTKADDREFWWHLFPLFHFHREEDATNFWLLWPLYGFCSDETTSEQRFLHFLRFGDAPDDTPDDTPDNAPHDTPDDAATTPSAAPEPAAEPQEPGA